MKKPDVSSWPTIPGYTLIDIAGFGGGGVVYSAEEDESGRPVAIKTLLHTGQREKLDRFRREARILASLEHPHILPIYDFGVVDDLPYLVTRLAKGGSLADRLDHGPIPVAQAVQWAIHIAEALELAHLQGLLHRDVKPSNMLLDENDQVYLADFGLAGTFDDEEMAQAGSALYMSPERGRGEIQVDVTADVYALAVSLFEMLTGVPPYVGDNPLAIRVRHIEDPIPSARALNPEVSLSIDDLIQWCMAKEPQERPPSAATFVQAAKIALNEPDRAVRLPSYLNLDAQPLVPSVDYHAFPPTVRDTSPSLAARKAAEERDKAPAERPSFALSTPLLAGIVVGLLFLLLIGYWMVPSLLNQTGTPTTSPQTPSLTTVTPLPTPFGRLLFDDFSDPAASNDAVDEARLVNEALQIESEDPQFRIYWPTEQIVADRVSIMVDWLPSDRLPDYEFGLLCRFEDVQNYEGIVLTVEGEAGSAVAELWRVVAGEIEILAAEPLNVVDLSRSQTHQLTFNCLASGYEFWLDGEQRLAAPAANGTPAVGDVAVMSRPLSADNHLIRIDNLLVEDPS